MAAVTSMSSLERQYFEQVAHQCSDDVGRFCEDQTVQSLLSFPPPPPFFLNDLGNVVDRLMSTVLEDVARMSELSTVMEQQQQPQPERTLDVVVNAPRPMVVVQSYSSPMSPAEDVFVRQMLSQFVPMITVGETDSLAQRLSEHGSAMLQRIPDESGNEFRIARRLSEVTAEEVSQVRSDLFLPFGPEKNECIYQAYHQRRVSQGCGSSLYTLEQVRAARFQKQQAQYESEMEAFSSLSLMYFFIFATSIVLYCCRRSSAARAEHRDPEAVQEMKSFRTLTVVVFGAMTILTFLGYLPLSLLLQACVWFSAFIFLRAVFTSSCCEDDEEDEDVGCCGCCEDCACCQSGCCDGDGCCTEGCCCCTQEKSTDYKLMTDDDEDLKPKKKVVTRKTFILHEGVPVQVV